MVKKVEYAKKIIYTKLNDMEWIDEAMTINDIARMAGVSIATVSRVVNGKSVKKSTREAVVKAIEKSGYVPNAFARGLVTSETTTVGVLIADIADVFFASQLSVVETELNKSGYNIIVVCINEDMSDDMQKRQVQFLLGNHVAGIILIGPQFANSAVQKYLEASNAQIPLILLNDFSNTENTYCVVADDASAIAAAVKSLYEKGKRNFVYLYDRVNPSGLEKQKGFRDGVLACGLAFRESQLVRCVRSIKSAEEVTFKLLSGSMPVDAIITAQDELAVGALKAACRLKIDIPRALAIVGYNNSQICQSCTPELSSIDNNVQVSSKLAIDTFLRVIENQAVPNQILLSCCLIDRETT